MAAPYYVTHNAGGGGAGTEGDPFTLAEACDAVAAGETVYVKASGAYSTQDGATGCVFNPSVPGGITTLVLWQGYHTTINDGLMIPAEFADGLLLNESGINDDWMSRMTIEATSSNAKTFKRSASNTLGGSVGIQAARIAEDTQMSSTREVFETTKECIFLS